MSTSSPTTQSLLADYFEGQAQWRELKAEEYPEDDRNLRSAAALRELATFVLSLKPGDYRVNRMEILLGDAGDVMTPGAAASEAAGQVGFHRETSPEQALIDFLRAALADFSPETLGPVRLLEMIDESESDSLLWVRLLGRWCEDVEESLVLKARVEGRSWQAIGDALGCTKQAAWERFRDPQDPSPEE
jgi:hypothetical protein